MPTKSQRRKTTMIKKVQTMTEQKQPQTITKVKSHVNDLYLIKRDHLIEDFSNRVRINNYEINKAWDDFKNVINKIQNLKSEN